jgi:hypothetical protein
MQNRPDLAQVMFEVEQFLLSCVKDNKFFFKNCCQIAKAIKRSPFGTKKAINQLVAEKVVRAHPLSHHCRSTWYQLTVEHYYRENFNFSVIDDSELIIYNNIYTNRKNLRKNEPTHI